MRAYIYRKLYEFNLHIEQGVMLLRDMAKVKKARAEEVRRYAGYFEEIRTTACGYLGSIFFDQEEREAGRFFARRRRREMAEDPLHGGLLKRKEKKSGRRE